jgi:hypothetical protein
MQFVWQLPGLHLHSRANEQVNDSTAGVLCGPNLTVRTLEAVRTAIVVSADSDHNFVGSELDVAA